MGSLNGRLDRLERRIGISGSEGAKRQVTDERRAEIRAELEAFGARLRSLGHQGKEDWRNSPEGQAFKRELEAELQRRRLRGA